MIANLDPTASHTLSPNYDVTGTWYKYNGIPTVDGTSFTVNNVADSYTLAGSEMVVLTNFPVDSCTDVRNNNDGGMFSLRNAISCAQDGGTVHLEYPVFGQTITLNSPLIIDKNITISGFQSMNIHINGSNINTPVWSIAAGKSVTMQGLTFTCSQGNAEGRCLINEGDITLDNILFQDINGSSMGNSIKNLSSGTISIKNNVTIEK